MSYLKLCQLLSQNQIEIFYQEDCDGNVLINNIPSYPITIECEVIDWESEEEFKKRGKIISFTSVNISLNEQPIEIRETIYQQLLIQYPNLIK